VNDKNLFIKRRSDLQLSKSLSTKKRREGE